VINLDHDDDWVLLPGKTLRESGVGPSLLVCACMCVCVCVCVCVSCQTIVL
jgi:hypothetical protein